VPWPVYTDKFGYELEIGAVIGTSGWRIGAGDAALHIGGDTLYNDWSARDIQEPEMRVGVEAGDLQGLRLITRSLHCHA
jgi:2-keto-4-pentenoate hydratase/2-oxohepta-3-ene-1,7-dioic acid hydratase in catechol pathway